MIHLLLGSGACRYYPVAPFGNSRSRTRSLMPQAGARHPPRFSTAFRSYSEPSYAREGLFSSMRGGPHLSEAAREGSTLSAATAVVVGLGRRGSLAAAVVLSVSACTIPPEEGEA